LKARRRRAFKKNDFGVSIGESAGNTKIVFIMRIAGRALPCLESQLQWGMMADVLICSLFMLALSKALYSFTKKAIAKAIKKYG
jgi:hypothetical protein